MAQKRHHLWLGLVALTSFLLLGHPAAANQAEWISRVWQLDEGLPGNSVTGIAQTPDGYLWISTEGGLARFDGVRFQNIPVPIPSGRKRPIIRALLLGAGSQLWLALEGGMVVSLQGETIRLFTKADGLSGVRCENMALDREQNVWTSHSDGSVCRIAHGVVTRFADEKSPPGEGPCFLAGDREGQVWFAREHHVGVIREGGFQSLFQPAGEVIRLGAARAGGVWVCAGLQLQHCRDSGEASPAGSLPVARPGVEATAVFEDRTGAVWVGTSVDGLFRYDGHRFARGETSNEMILSLGEDREGNVWAGTGGGGLDRLRPRLVDLQTSEEGLPAATVRSICEDRQGVMWAVGENGGLARRVGEKWHPLTTEDGWSGARATVVASDQQGGIWLGTATGALWHQSGGRWLTLGRAEGLGGDVVRGLLVDHTGDLWIALESPACLQRLHQGQFKTFSSGAKGAIRALAEDTAGTVWGGTQDGLLFRVEGDELRNETAHTFAQPKPIRCLRARPDGSLLIGYGGGGLGVWRQGRFVQVSEEQGLFDAYICSLGEDDRGGLWCATDHGLFQVPMSEIEAVAEGRATQVHSIHLGRDEGLQNLQGAFGYAPGQATSGDGRLWFPMRSGLAVVNPRRLATKGSPPIVLLEHLAVDGLPAQPTAKGDWILPAAHQRLEIAFTAPTFTAAEDVRFRYRLAGADTGWNESGTQRRAIYSRLPAGDYRFAVAASSSVGRWQTAETFVALTVLPSFWERWPVRAATFVLFTLGIVATARYVSYRRLARKLERLEQESALYRERARIAQDLHDDIGASLTHIALLSELAQKDLEQPAQARAHLDQIFHSARTVTRSLDEIVWTVNPKNDTLDIFVTHLCTYAPEYLRSAGVRCRLDVPLEIPARPLSSQVGHHLYLAVKETLHNIVKHAGAGEVWLRLRLQAEAMTITLEDNGCGFQPAAPHNPEADGLGNLKRRLSSIGGRCEQRSEPGRGTATAFTVTWQGLEI